MTWAHVQGQHNALTSGGSNWTLSKAGSTIGTGNLIVGCVTWGTGTTTDLTSVKVGTTSCTIVSRVADTTNSQSYALFYLNNVPAGQTTVTAAGAAGGGAVLIIWDEFSGNDSSSVANGSASKVLASPGIGTDTIKTSSTVGASGNLIYGGTIGDTNTGTLAAGTGFTTATNDNADSGFFGISAFSEFKTASGASDATFTLSVSNGSYLVGVLAFTPAATGGNTISGSISLADITLTSSVKVTDTISGSLSLADITLSSSVKVTDKISGSLSMPLLTITSSLKAIDTISGTISLADLTLTSSVKTLGNTISGSLALADLTLTSALAVTDNISGSLALPNLTITSTIHVPTLKPQGGAIYEYQDTPWYFSRYDPEKRLAESRREIGIIPKEAKRAVERAARIIIAEPQKAKTEAKAFDLVKAYERQFRKAFREIFRKAKMEADREYVDKLWREEVARSLVEKADEEVLLLVAAWLV